MLSRSTTAQTLLNRWWKYLVPLLMLQLLLCVYLFKFGFPSPKKISPPYKRSVVHNCSRHTHNELVLGIKLNFYIISHDQKSQDIASRWSKCMPWATVVHVPKSTYFESVAYKAVFPALRAEWESADLVAVATYKSLKFLSVEKLAAYAELSVRGAYDVVPLYTSGDRLLSQATAGHGPEFRVVWDAALQQLGFDERSIRAQDSAEAFFRNTYIATPRWFDRLGAFMRRAIDVADAAQRDGGSRLGELLRTDARYREGKLLVSQRLFGGSYYQWHPFVFERLPVFFLHHSGARVFTTLRQVVLFENGLESAELLFKGL